MTVRTPLVLGVRKAIKFSLENLAKTEQGLKRGQYNAMTENMI